MDPGSRSQTAIRNLPLSDPSKRRSATRPPRTRDRSEIAWRWPADRTTKIAEHADGLVWLVSREAHLVKREAAELSVTSSQLSEERRFSSFVLAYRARR
jgi:hypothetical protein